MQQATGPTGRLVQVDRGVGSGELAGAGKAAVRPRHSPPTTATEVRSRQVDGVDELDRPGERPGRWWQDPYSEVEDVSEGTRGDGAIAVGDDPAHLTLDHAGARKETVGSRLPALLLPGPTADRLSSSRTANPADHVRTDLRHRRQQFAGTH